MLILLSFKQEIIKKKLDPCEQGVFLLFVRGSSHGTHICFLKNQKKKKKNTQKEGNIYKHKPSNVKLFIETGNLMRRQLGATRGSRINEQGVTETDL